MAYDIARKIRALVAKAESTQFSEEADTILQKVSYMLERHGMSLLQINTAAHDDPVGVDPAAAYWWKSDNWCRGLALRAAKLYGVQIVLEIDGNKTTAVIAGRESCRAAFTVMYPYLRKEVMRIANLRHKDGTYHSVSRARRDIGNALSVRLGALIREREKGNHSPQVASGLNALVPVHHIDIVMNQHFAGGTLRTTKGRSIGYSRGAKEDAAQIALSDQISAGKGGRLAISS